jgi:hypothetical protein
MALATKDVKECMLSDAEHSQAVCSLLLWSATGGSSALAVIGACTCMTPSCNCCKCPHSTNQLLAEAGFLAVQ